MRKFMTIMLMAITIIAVSFKPGKGEDAPEKPKIYAHTGWYCNTSDLMIGIWKGTTEYQLEQNGATNLYYESVCQNDPCTQRCVRWWYTPGNPTPIVEDGKEKDDSNREKRPIEKLK